VKYGCGEIEVRGRHFRVRAYLDGKRTPLGTYTTETEAKSVLDGLAALHCRGETSATAQTLRSYGAQWLNHRELEGKRSVSSDRSRWEKHIVPESWAGLPLADVRKRDIREWASRLRKARSPSGKPISAQTVLHCVKLVSTCFRSAIEDELVDKNPVAGLQIQRPRPSPDMWTYLTVAEQNQLATFEVAAKNERETLLIRAERLIALIGIGTGMRQGEQWNLELRDVHVDAPEPWLFVRWGSKGKPPKNGRPRRLPLFGIGLAAMKEWLRTLPRYSAKNPHGLLFPTERGCRRQKKPPRRWARILKSAKLHDLTNRHDRRPIRWHDLRHW
jgi:integrase